MEVTLADNPDIRRTERRPRRWSRGALLRDVRNRIAIYEAERKRIRAERRRLRADVRGLRRSVACARRTNNDGLVPFLEEEVSELQGLISILNQSIPMSDECGRLAVARMLEVVRRVAPWACQSERQRQRHPGRRARSRSSHRAVARVARPAAKSTADPDGESHGNRPRLSSGARP